MSLSASLILYTNCKSLLIKITDQSFPQSFLSFIFTLNMLSRTLASLLRTRRVLPEHRGLHLHVPGQRQLADSAHRKTTSTELGGSLGNKATAWESSPAFLQEGSNKTRELTYRELKSKKIKLITRPQEEQIDQGGVLWRKLNYSDQFIVIS